MVFGVVMPYFYNPDAANAGSFSAFVYTGFSALAVVITFYHVPEMKGRPAREVDKMFDLRLPAREFKRWTDDESTVLT